MECSPPGSSVHGILQARILEWVAVPSSTDLPNPRIEPRSPTLQADSLLSEPLRKPKNSGVGSLSLLQGIFLTQESNPRFLHCRQILYHPSHQRSPDKEKSTWNKSDSERQILHDFTDMCNLQRKPNHKNRIKWQLLGVGGEWVKVVKRLQTSSFDMNKFWGSTVQHGNYS